MHEMGIASSILDAVRKELLPYPAARPLKVIVRIGAMSGVDPNSLSFCYEVLVNGTEFESMAMEVVAAPADELELASLELEEPI